MINRSQNSARKAILTNIERDYLNMKKPINPKIKSKLIHKLDERFVELFKDLEIIRRSPILNVWKYTRREPFGTFTGADINLLQQIFSKMRRVHLAIIRRTKKGKRYLYWLDESPHYQGTIRNDSRSLKPEFVLRRLGTNVKEEFSDILVKAYLGGKLTKTPTPLDKLK